jgi:Fur family ferric uptake transcriptional regulator
MSCGERLAGELRRRGYRVTPQRAVILETVAHMEGHPSVQQVHQVACARLPGLNLATVYRTFDVLQKAGLVDYFSTGAGLDRYALRDPDHPHGHLVCRACGEVLEFDPQLTNRLEAALIRKHGFQLDPSHITLTGLCAACAGEQRADSTARAQL